MAARPSFREFIELPIQVQHVWDAYPVVDQALQDLETGLFNSAAQLTDALYTDDRIIGVLSTRINALFGLPIEFKYQGQDETEAKAAPDSAGDELVELKKRIRDLAEQNWERMFPAGVLKEVVRWGIMLNAGLGELVWRWGSDNLIYPTLKSWNPQFLYWRWDTRNYWLIHQDGQLPVGPGDGKWMLFAPTGHNHGWLYGLVRALAKLWLDRIFTFRDWSRFEEKLGLGILLAKTPADALKEDKNAFLNAVSNPASEAVVHLPQTKNGGFDLAMLQTQGSGNATGWEAFKERVHQLDTSIAVCVLGQNLSTEISGSTGSRAAAQVHENIRGDFLKADVEILQTVLKTQVYGPWVRFNWGDQAARLGVTWKDLVPDVTMRVEPPEDKKGEAEAINQIAQAIPGLQGTEADIRALLEQHGVPVLEQRSAPERPPPGADVDERPRAEEPILNRVELARAPHGVKAGARKGQLFVDDVADRAKALGVKALEPMRMKLLRICETAESYEEIRTRVKELYMSSGKSPAELREIVARSIAVAELVGRLSAHEDVHG